MTDEERKLNPDMDRLMAKPYPDLAHALIERKDPILKRWQAEVCRELPHADGLTLTQVNDDVPLMIDWMSSALRTRDTKSFDEFLNRTPKHGETRFHQDFNLN